MMELLFQRTTCPFCFKFVSRKATICPFCRSKLE